jgi:hypothetical protein
MMRTPFCAASAEGAPYRRPYGICELVDGAVRQYCALPYYDGCTSRQSGKVGIDAPRLRPGSALTGMELLRAVRDGPAFVGVLMPDAHSLRLRGFIAGQMTGLAAILSMEAPSLWC